MWYVRPSGRFHWLNWYNLTSVKLNIFAQGSGITVQVNPASDWSTVATSICTAHQQKKMRDVAEPEARRFFPSSAAAKSLPSSNSQQCPNLFRTPPFDRLPRALYVPKA
jgi:hypothetical protein